MVNYKRKKFYNVEPWLDKTMTGTLKEMPSFTLYFFIIQIKILQPEKNGLKRLGNKLECFSLTHRFLEIVTIPIIIFVIATALK